MKRIFLSVSVCIFLLSCGDDKKVKSLTEEQLLDTIQRGTFNYFYGLAHPKSGMGLERSSVSNRGKKPVYDVSNTVTTGGTGFGIMGFPVAVERGWISRDEASKHLLKVVHFLGAIPRYKGMFAHWYNGNTGERISFSEKDDGGDVVESAFLFQGLLTVRAYFNQDNEIENELRNLITKLWEEADWQHYTNGKPWIYWHWSPNYNFEMNMQIMGFDETHIVYILATSSPTHPIDSKIYETGWAADKHDRLSAKGNYIQRLMPKDDNYAIPLFWTHYSYLGMSPYVTDKFIKQTKYKNYYEHHRAVSLFDYEYCKNNDYPDNCWGLTSGDNPLVGYNGHAPKKDRDDGTITVTAGISSIVYTPKKSMDFMHYLWDNHKDSLWTDYGFKDGFNLKEKWYAPAHLAIDQGPIVVMIENHRTGMIWDLFMDIPEVKSGLKKLGIHINK